MIKKNRDPRWGEEFEFMLEEPPTNDRLHVEVISASSRIGLLHPKVGTLLFLRSYAISIMIKYMIIHQMTLVFFPCCTQYKQETLGYVDINLADVVNNKRINQSYNLIDSKNGRIQIELQWRTSS